MAENGANRKSSDSSGVAEQGCMDDEKKVDRSQMGLEHAVRSRARLCVKIVRSERKPLYPQAVDPLLTRWIPR